MLCVTCLGLLYSWFAKHVLESHCLLLYMFHKDLAELLIICRSLPNLGGGGIVL